MRKRNMFAGFAALALLAAGSVALADQPDSGAASPLAIGGADAGTVVLPTGDKVTIAPNGLVAVTAADDDTGYWRPVAGDGSNDTIVVPFAAAEDLVAGDQDPRRYNVSALLRAGITDAAAAPESDLDDGRYGTYEPVEASTAAQPVTFSVSGHAGNVPQVSDVLWASLDDDEAFDRVEIGADGTGTVELEPGDYDVKFDLATEPVDGERGEVVSGISTFTVADEPVEVTADGTEATAVSVEVDREDAQLQGQIVDVHASGSNISTWTGVSGEYDSYILPSASGKPGLTFVYSPVLTGGTTEPYTYNLTFADTEGVPDDLAFSASDSELAVVDTHFNSLGVDAAGSDCAVGLHSDAGANFANCWNLDISVPQSRTMYYTPGPIEYQGFSAIGDSDVAFVSDGQTYEAGSARESRHNAPATIGFFYSGVSRWGDGIATQISMMDNFDVGTEVVARDYTGTITLSEGDTVLGEYQGSMADFDDGFDLPADAAGRYSLHVEGTQDGAVSALGTENSVSWEFDSPAAPSGEDEAYLDASNVVLAAEGVVDGHADRDVPQPVNLEYRAQPFGADTTADELAMEVSYDDGDTWQDVAIDRDGDTAEAVLDHPADAEFVSVRFHATSTTGGVLDQTTIRSWGLS